MSTSSQITHGIGSPGGVPEFITLGLSHSDATVPPTYGTVRGVLRWTLRWMHQPVGFTKFEPDYVPASRYIVAPARVNVVELAARINTVSPEARRQTILTEG